MQPSPITTTFETQGFVLEQKEKSEFPLQTIVGELFEKSISKDAYNNCTINLSASSDANRKDLQDAIKNKFSELVKNLEGYNHLIVRIDQKQNRLYKCLMQHDFTVHHSENKDLILKRCLGEEADAGCQYPPFKTMSLGITVVIFNSDLSEFLAIQEKTGYYKGWKAPTGSVDYEQEDEAAAAVREVKEETNLDILPEHLVLVGMAPTNNLRGRSPDRNFVFVCKTDITEGIKPQEKEIKQVAWISVNDFLTSKLPVSHELRPLILQEVVRIAKTSLENNHGWKASAAYWGSGKPAILYQEQSSRL